MNPRGEKEGAGKTRTFDDDFGDLPRCPNWTYSRLNVTSVPALSRPVVGSARALVRGLGCCCRLVCRYCPPANSRDTRRVTGWMCLGGSTSPRRMAACRRIRLTLPGPTLMKSEAAKAPRDSSELSMGYGRE